MVVSARGIDWDSSAIGTPPTSRTTKALMSVAWSPTEAAAETSMSNLIHSSKGGSGGAIFGVGGRVILLDDDRWQSGAQGRWVVTKLISNS